MKKNYLFLILLTISFLSNAQDVNIPDANFKAYLVSNTAINTNGDAVISITEAEAFTGKIDVNDSKIINFIGLEAFVNLTEFKSNFIPNLESIDISKNINLTNLSIIHSYKLTSLDISKNTKLTSLNCGSNSLETLDVSNNLELLSLSCTGNKLSSLDVSNNIKLTSIVSLYNNITEIDLSNNVNLTWVKFNHNKIQSFNIANGNNTIITQLNISDNFLACIQVDDVDFAENNNDWVKDEYPFYSLNCTGEEGQEIVTINDANFKNHLLNKTDLNVNEDDEIQVFEAANYNERIYFDSDNYEGEALTDLTGLEAFKNLTQLQLGSTNITSIDLSQNTKLTYLGLQDNDLITSLDTDDLINLTRLSYSFAKLESLDVSKNTKLTSLTCYYNNLTTLDVSKNTELTSLNCSNNQLITLDVSANTKLASLDCIGNLLENLNIANGNNENFSEFKANYNANLFCIKVDEVNYSTTNWINKDGHAEFTTDCSGYTPTEYTLTTEVENGTITANPASEDGTYVKGTEVRLTVEANEGFQFTGWDGYEETTNYLTVTIDADKTITATFSASNSIVISEFANGFSDLKGIGINSNNEVYVSELYTGKIYHLNANGIKTEFTEIGRPTDITFDSNDKLFVTNNFYGKIFEANSAGILTEYVDVYAGNLHGITFYQDNLYVTETNDKRVVKINSDKTKEDYANGFSLLVKGLSFDSQGNLYVTDFYKLHKIIPNENKIELGSGFGVLGGVAIANDMVYFTDYSNDYNRVVKYNPSDNSFSDYVTTNLDEPTNLDIDKLGNMYVLNQGNGTVVKIFDEDLKPNATANVNDEIFNNKISVFPNPTKGEIKVNTTGEIISEIKIIDVLGKEVLKTKFSYLDISHLPKGVYFLKIKGNNNKLAIKKIIKK